jgi:hypothetical protein
MPKPEASPADKNAPASRPFGIHIYLYLSIAVLLLCFAASMVMGFVVVDLRDSPAWMEYALPAAPILFLATLWLALKHCSAADLSGFRGLLFITAYMSIGIGGFSMIFAIPAVMFAILGCLFIGAIRVFRADSNYAPRQFRKLIMVYYRHRMYQ